MEKKYLEKRKEFRELLEKKQKEKRKEKEEELKKLKQIYGNVYLNRKRDKKIWKENNIKNEEWRKYFKELLDENKA